MCREDPFCLEAIYSLPQLPGQIFTKKWAFASFLFFVLWFASFFFCFVGFVLFVSLLTQRLALEIGGLLRLLVQRGAVEVANPEHLLCQHIAAPILEVALATVEERREVLHLVLVILLDLHWRRVRRGRGRRLCLRGLGRVALRLSRGLSGLAPGLLDLRGRGLSTCSRGSRRSRGGGRGRRRVRQPLVVGRNDLRRRRGLHKAVLLQSGGSLQNGLRRGLLLLAGARALIDGGRDLLAHVLRELDPAVWLALGGVRVTLLLLLLGRARGGRRGGRALNGRDGHRDAHGLEGRELLRVDRHLKIVVRHLARGSFYSLALVALKAYRGRMMKGYLISGHHNHSIFLLN